MISLRKIASLAVKLPFRNVAPFAGGNWKDRDEAAEKVYISQAESNNHTIQNKL
jgi:hypothetical protein